MGIYNVITRGGGAVGLGVEDVVAGPAHLLLGGVGAAVVTKNGNIYTGVCIDTDCSLGMCAERNAISTMITNGEFEIKMAAAVDKKRNVLPPCGACREFLMQLKNSEKIEVLADNNGTVVKLKDLMPYSYS